MYIVLVNVSILNSNDLFIHTGAEEILAREEAIEAARRRMQEQYDLKAKEAAIKQKEVLLEEI